MNRLWPFRNLGLKLLSVGIGTMLMFLNYSVVFGLMRGVKVRTAYAVGEGRPADGLRYAQAGLVIGAAVGLHRLRHAQRPECVTNTV